MDGSPLEIRASGRRWCNVTWHSPCPQSSLPIPHSPSHSPQYKPSQSKPSQAMRPRESGAILRQNPNAPLFSVLPSINALPLWLWLWPASYWHKERPLADWQRATGNWQRLQTHSQTKNLTIYEETERHRERAGDERGTELTTIQ